MAQSGFTPILLYASGTASAAPTAGNLTSSASGAELALNYADGKLFYKDSGGVVQTLATKATGTIGGSTTQVQYNLSGALAGSANMTFNGTRLTVADLADSSLTSGRVTYAGAGGALTDSTNLTFDGTALTLGGNPTLSAGTANGVLYLDGSKVLTSGSALTFDGTTLTLSSNPTLSGGTVNSIPYLNASKSLVSGAVLGFNGSQMDIGVGVYYGRLNVGRDSAAPYATLMMGDQATPTNSVGVYMRQTSGASGISTAGADMAFFLGGPGVSEQMRLTSTGLGIGTTPGQRLAVRSADNLGTTNIARFESNNAAQGVVVRFASVLGDGGNTSFGTLTNNAMLIAVNNSEVARFDTSGNLGIGTSSPSGKLDVRSGYIVSGTAPSTNGSKILGGYYTSGHLATFGGEYSNGGPVIGYGVWPSTAAAGSFVSSTTLNVQRGAYTILGANHIWYGGDAQTVAIDSAVTTTERMRLDSSGNLGLGVTPSAWGSSFKTLNLNTTAILSGFDNGGGNRQVAVGLNWYDNTAGGSAKYKITGYASNYSQYEGSHIWQTAPSGTAGNAISFTQAMTLDASGNLGVGTTSPSWRVHAVSATDGRIQVEGSSGYGMVFVQASSGNAAQLQLNSNGGSGKRFAISSSSTGALTFSDETAATERARIDSSGRFMVGTTGAINNNMISAYGTNQNGFVSQVTNNIYSNFQGFNSSAVVTFQVEGSGNTTIAGYCLLKGDGFGLGYTTGSGGAVTQTTSRTTGVTLNKTNGQITLVSAAGTTTWQSFTVTNSTVAATDVIRVVQTTGTDLYQIHVTAVSAGSFRITFATTGGTTTEQPVFNFAVIKAVNA